MKDGSIPVAHSAADFALTAQSLVKRYKHATCPALDNFNLQLRKGEFFGLLGPNGAGKTTAISILSGLFPPTSGTISIMGMHFKKQSQAIKQILGLVPQDIALYDPLTAVENLVFFGKLYALEGNTLQSRIDRSLDLTGLSGRGKSPVSTFSGGMKRRLNLAVGLLNDPQILFLDEPTVGIDAQSRHLIHEQLLALNKEGMTILYTTHYMEEAMELCSRIGIMDDGRIIEQGDSAELLRQNQSCNLGELFLQLTGKGLRDT